MGCKTNPQKLFMWPNPNGPRSVSKLIASWGPAGWSKMRYSICACKNRVDEKLPWHFQFHSGWSTHQPNSVGFFFGPHEIRIPSPKRLDDQPPRTKELGSTLAKIWQKRGGNDPNILGEFSPRKLWGFMIQFDGPHIFQTGGKKPPTSLECLKINGSTKLVINSQ